MDKSIEKLIRKARGGGAEEGLALGRALRAAEVPLALLLEFAQAEEEALRLAAADAARDRTEPQLLAALETLAVDKSVLVRRALAQAWAEARDWPLPAAAARALFDDGIWDVRLAAVRAAGGRLPHLTRVLGLLDDARSWEVRQAVAEVLTEAPAARVLGPLLVQLADDQDQDVSFACATTCEALLDGAGGWPAGLEPPRVRVLESCQARVLKLGERRYPLLLAWLHTQVETEIDPASLSQFGADLSVDAEEGALARAFDLGETCERLVEILSGEAPRAAVLLGETGTGKTAIVHELTYRLLNGPGGPWRVLRISPSDIMAGTVYMGEWETKVRNIIRLAKRPRRVVLFVPNIDGLQDAGRHSRSANNALAMLAPHIESGDIAIIGESTPETFRAGLGRQAAMRKLFRTVDCKEATPAQARAIAEAVCEDAGIETAPGVIERLQEMAGFFLAGTVEPGRTVGLLRRVLEAQEGDGPLQEADVLATLATITGVPRVVLDDEQPLDPEELRTFFDTHVMGQPEARDAVLDLVTLIKAGLTDPSKPYGVLFFVGPTGVGKTEMARTLAHMLFGDPARLHRFDMSEYATFQAFERLMGTASAPGLLTEVVRADPFAVILLDEIEKAHLNVYDLCLQIFDAGRLTDGQGRTADFRRAIVILTSNVGSAVPTESAVGFGGGLPPPPDPEHIERALRQTFRPEFLGRLDRIVHFRPLAVETAERIARREIRRVLERSGITRRGLVVDVDPAVLSFLLREGYSPALGARPLKRTVERHILLPVARVIARGAAPRGSILRLRPRAKDIAVEITPPEAPHEEGGEGTRPLSRPAAALHERVGLLAARLEALAPRCSVIAEQRSRLLEASHAPTFWDDRASALELLDEVHRWERILDSHERLARRVRDTAGHVRAVAAPKRPPAELLRRVEELERETSVLAYLLTAESVEDLGDALVTVARVKSQGAPLGGTEKTAGMYVGFAKRLGLEVEVLSDRDGGSAEEDEIALHVMGVGAYGLLRGEQGLHQFTQESEGEKPQRALIRVDVLPGAAETRIRADEVRVNSKLLPVQSGRLLERPALEMTLVHLPSMQSLTAWTTGSKREALDRLMPLLCARVAHPAGPESVEGGPMVRRYRLGSAPLVRDRRTGKTTGRLPEVLAGGLDRFLVLEEAAGR